MKAINNHKESFVKLVSKKISFIAMSMTLAMSLPAVSQESSDSTTESTIKKSDVVPAESAVKDIDDEIKNKKMRAELGSKKKLSMSLSLGYSGGSVEKPLDRTRPNYRSGKVGVATLTSLGGSVSMKYRLSERDAVSFGTGVSYLTPFYNSSNELRENKSSETGKSLFNVSTPFISYSRAYKAFGMQNVTGAGYSHTTTQEILDRDKMTGSPYISHTFIASPVEGLDVGLASYLYTYFYTDAVEAGDTRSAWEIGLYPFLEYAFTENASFRTVFGYFNYEQARGTSEFVNGLPYQSMGIGYSVTRDIYLYPNVQFIPNNIRGDLTNLALSTTINL